MRKFLFSVVAAVFVFSSQGVHGDVSVYTTEVGFGDSLARQTFSTDITSSTYESLDFLPGLDPRSVSVDRVNNRVYYSYGNSIAVSNLDGSNKSLVIDTGFGVGDLKINPVNGKIYYYRSSGTSSIRGIYSVNTDGTGNTKILDNADLAGEPTITVNSVNNIEIDTENDRLYWTADDGGVAGRIGLNVASLTGGGVSQLWVGASRSDSIDKMAIDFDESMLYYSVGSTTNAVFRSTLSNAAIETLASGLGRPGAITVDLENDDLFFMIGGTMYQSELDGSGLLSKVISLSSLYSVSDMDYADLASASIPEPSSLWLIGLGALGMLRRRRC